MISIVDTLDNFKINSHQKVKTGKGLMTKSALAGAFIAMGGIASITVSALDSPLAKIFSGLVFPIGLILIVCFGMELFTGDVLVIPATLDFSRSIVFLIAVWAGNFMGAELVAAAFSEIVTDPAIKEKAIEIVEYKVNMDPCAILFSAMFCNILVCSAVLLAKSAQSLVGKMMGAAFPVFIFVICGFEHCVANMFYIPLGVFCKGSIDNEFFFLCADELIFATLGNVAGGLLLGFSLYHLYGKDNEI
jgi:formate/nitrite transporter